MTAGRSIKPVAAIFAATVLLVACDRTSETRRPFAVASTANAEIRPEHRQNDAPVSNSVLAKNFERIALFREYRLENDQLVEKSTAVRLSRWEKPIRYAVGGDAATNADRAEYTKFVKRLATLTGLEIAEGKADPNLSILILGPEERPLFVAQLEKDGLADDLPLVVEWAESDYSTCVGQIAFDDINSGQITGAMVLIKGELEGVGRSSCIHEELTQTLGLMNDDPEVRPSIFNDDQEFALLTEHDEILLRILYDRRLRPGMDADEARPLLPEIIEEIRPSGA